MNPAFRPVIWFGSLVALALLAFLVHVLNLQVLKAERVRAEAHMARLPLMLPADPAPVTLTSLGSPAEDNALTEAPRARSGATASARSSARSR